MKKYNIRPPDRKLTWNFSVLSMSAQSRSSVDFMVLFKLHTLYCMHIHAYAHCINTHAHAYTAYVVWHNDHIISWEKCERNGHGNDYDHDYFFRYRYTASV
jgi:fructose/tagatose bisphosphate aldolase